MIVESIANCELGLSRGVFAIKSVRND